ncbi:MAG: YhcH/YjgK/YiaL family protein, partial [Bacteroidales bacterium]
MILTNLKNVVRYQQLHPQFTQLFNYLQNTDIINQELGRIELCGEELFINNVLIDGAAKKQQPLEVHQKYIDLHLLLEGEETIAYLPTEKIRYYAQSYNADFDCALTHQIPENYIVLTP